MLILSDLEEAFPVSVRAVYDTLAVDRGFRTSSDGVELGVRAPRVLDPPLDLQLPLCPRPRCARSLLISVVSIDGSESGIGLVLVRGSIWVAPERNVVETRLLLAVLSLLPSLIPDFSLDRALSLVTGCALLRIFLGVAVRGLERGVAAEINGVGFTLVLF